MSTRGLFITGTGTSVGKSVVSAAIARRLADDGARVAAFKPVVTGLDEPDADWPMDHELLAAQTGQDPAAVTAYTYGPAVSPHLAAELAGDEIKLSEILRAYNTAAASADVVIAEGVGGVLVPLGLRVSVLDFAKSIKLPVVVATHPGLGTISDTRLTVDRLIAEGLTVSAVVISGWPQQPDTMLKSNRETLAALLPCDVATLGVVTPGSLAGAAEHLPLENWMGADPGTL